MISPVNTTAAGRHWGTAAGLLAVLLWSSTVAMGRSLSEQLGPLTAAAAVFLAAGLPSVVRLALSRGSRRSLRSLPLRYVAACGALFVINNLALFLALGLATDRSQALETGLLNYLWPTLTILLSIPLLGQACTWLLLPATALALGGVFLVLTPPQQCSDMSIAASAAHIARNPAAYALALTAAVSWSLCSNLTRRWVGGRSGAVDLFLPTTGIVLLAVCLLSSETPAWTLRAAALTAAFGAITALAYSSWDLAMRRGDAMTVSVSSYATPLLSAAVTCLTLRISAGPRFWLGCALLVTGSLLSWRSMRCRSPAACIGDGGRAAGSS